MLRLTFDNDQILDIEPINTDLSQKWFEKIKDTKYKNIGIRENNRIYNMNNYWTEEKTIEKIYECIEIINSYKPVIKQLPNKNLTQDELNHLHHYFERLIGLDNSGSKIFNRAPDNVKQAIKDFNVLIHRLECKQTKRIVVTFDYSKRDKLTETELADFTYDTKPGDVYLNYCHTGKTIYDFFRDEDKHIGFENILPQHQWRSDFVINFSLGPAYRPNFDKWVNESWNKYGHILNNLGLYRNDPKCAFGFGLVGKIKGDIQSTINRLYGIMSIKNYEIG